MSVNVYIKSWDRRRHRNHSDIQMGHWINRLREGGSELDIHKLINEFMMGHDWQFLNDGLEGFGVLISNVFNFHVTGSFKLQNLYTICI